MRVRDGVVTLSGDAAQELDGPAVAVVAETPGVKNLVNRVKIVPLYDTGWLKSGAIPGFQWGWAGFTESGFRVRP